jgi:hypothetical protein
LGRAENQILLKEISMSHKRVSCSIPLILICGALFGVPASAQHFEQVTAAGPLVSVAAGRNEVFGLESGAGAIWRYDASTKAFNRVAGTLQQVAVGGGTLSQLDAVWGIDGGAVYQFNFTTDVFDKVSAPALTQIVVGEGVEDNCHPYEVWGLVAGSSIYRYDYCTNSFELLVDGPWTQVATGGGDAWAIQTNPGATDGTAYYLSFSEEGFVPADGALLTQIAVGVNDVRGINSSNDVFRYDPTTAFAFVEQTGLLTQIAAGGDGAWGVNSSNEIFRFDPIANGWVQVPGALTSIAVGSGAGVWGVNSSGEVFTFVRP